MLSMLAEKSFSGQMFWILEKMSNTGENKFKIDYVIKWDLFRKRQQRFSV